MRLSLTIPSRFLMAMLALVFATLTTLQGATISGLVVTNDGSTPRGFSKATEYVSIAYYGNTYSVTLPDGNTVGGPTGQIMADVSYLDITDDQLKYMEATSKEFEYSRSLLKPRISALRNTLANPSSGPVVVPKPTIPFVTDGDRTYKNVRPSRLKNGVMSFFHDTGVFTTDAEPFSLRTLRKLAELNPDLADDSEFQQLVSTFIPILYFDQVDHVGAKVLHFSDNEVLLRTDVGVKSIPPDKIPKFAWKQLDEAKQRESTMLAGIAARKEAEIRQKAASQERLVAQRAAAQQEQQNKNLTALAKGVAAVAAIAIVAGIASKIFSRSDGGYSDAAPPGNGDWAAQQAINRRNDTWWEEQRDKEKEAIDRQNDNRRKDDDAWYEKKRQDDNNAYFERRKESQGS